MVPNSGSNSTSGTTSKLSTMPNYTGFIGVATEYLNSITLPIMPMTPKSKGPKELLRKKNWKAIQNMHTRKCR